MLQIQRASSTRLPDMAHMDHMDESQTRVADYLDDKLQTLRDLDSLDALLANVHNQHGLLKQQVSLSQASAPLHATETSAAPRCPAGYP